MTCLVQRKKAITQDTWSTKQEPNHLKALSYGWKSKRRNLLNMVFFIRVWLIWYNLILCNTFTQLRKKVMINISYIHRNWFKNDLLPLWLREKRLDRTRQHIFNPRFLNEIVFICPVFNGTGIKPTKTISVSRPSYSYWIFRHKM